ncbi:MAG: Y-family DNA polymerase [Dysgonamonadaceae bacterium]|jgi:DNA polymerase V|nr:Y-family DNA polymerase [Dysgonamonadaceae bacterium]
MFALVDCNNFFVSCERVFDSRLEGKPVIVLSNNDGCAIARSNEAKALGIKMGANYFEIEELCKKHDVQVFSTNFVLYADMSLRVRGLLAKFCPEIEDYSIDESFLDFSGFEQYFDLKTYCSRIAKTVKQGTGIPVSIGVAPTKTLAKIASRFAKKYSGYKDVCIIDSEEKRTKALQRCAIGDVWGIGRRYTKRLLAMNITTAYDFTQLSRAWVRKNMAVTGERTYRELLGESCVKMETIEPDRQTIMVSRSFGKMIGDYATLSEAVATYTGMGAAKLRKQKSCAKAVLVFIHTNHFRADLPQYSRHIVVTLPVASNSTPELLHYALEGLKNIFQPQFLYKKAGVMMMEIVPENAVQGNLFDKIDRVKHHDLMKVLDSVNEKYGRNTLKFAVMGDGKAWKIKQERLSPCYTTRLLDFPVTKS